jgi:hypothetical protein
MVTMFQHWTAKLVRERKKFQTIRPIGKRVPQVGEKISLREWSGLPYKSKQVLIYDGVIEDVFYVDIFPGGPGVKWKDVFRFYVLYKTYNDFAVADGYINYAHMANWFATQYGLPFTGRLIVWKEAA